MLSAQGKFSHVKLIWQCIVDFVKCMHFDRIIFFKIDVVLHGNPFRIFYKLANALMNTERSYISRLMEGLVKRNLPPYG
jgi:hypothetical protein